MHAFIYSSGSRCINGGSIKDQGNHATATQNPSFTHIIMKKNIHTIASRSITAIVLLAAFGVTNAQAERPHMPPQVHHAAKAHESDSDEQGPRAQREKPPAPEEVASHMLSSFDADATSSLDAKEFAIALDAARMQRHRKHEQVQQGEHTRIQRHQQADEDASQRNEIQVAMTAIDHFDVDQDSALDQEELSKVMAFVHAMRPRGGHGARRGHGGPPSQHM